MTKTTTQGLPNEIVVRIEPFHCQRARMTLRNVGVGVSRHCVVAQAAFDVVGGCADIG